jgi:hypothetical protein
MSNFQGFQGVQFPELMVDMTDESIATANLSPSENGSLTAAQKATYMDRGFAIANAGADDGYIYAITWWQYFNNDLSLTGLVPRKLYAKAGSWVYTPVVKCYAGNDGTYASTATTLQVGFFL